MNRRYLRVGAVALIAFLASSCARHPVVTLAVAGRSNENVSIAARGRLAVVVWSASVPDSTDIYAAVSDDAGATFAAPVRVNDIPGDARVGGEQPPQVALASSAAGMPEIVVLWTSKRADGSRLLSAHSSDGGRTFSAAAVIRASEAAGNRGWESLAVDSSGHALALWLDHRNVVAAPGAMHHAGMIMPPAAGAHGPDPVARAEQSQLYFAPVADTGGGKSVAAGVCYCCKTALAAGPQGKVYAAWRNVYAGNQRDIAFTTSLDNGATFAPPVRVSEDHWKFDGCPENGPAIAVDTMHHVHIVWPTPVNGQPDAPLALFYAMSADGTTFTPRVQVSAGGAAFHAKAQIADAGVLMVAWEQLDGGARTVRLARVTTSAAGHVAVQDIPLRVSATGVYPALAITTDGALVAWVGRGSAGTVITVARVAIP